MSLEALEELPECSNCGGARFRRASMFEQPTLVGARVEVTSQPDCLATARERLAGSGGAGQYLAFEDDDERETVVEIPQGWTRIGRSATADIRLDDPTVSRRHAVIVKTSSGQLRVLDDRSLNGVFVNGARAEWSRLHDGDEVMVGRFRLYVIDTAEAAETADPAETTDPADPAGAPPRPSPSSPALNG